MAIEPETASLLNRLVGHDRLPEGRYDKVEVGKAQSYAESIGTGITSENKHIENRVQWNLALQGFLYASYAIALSADKIPGEIRQGFVRIIADVGIASCSIAVIGLLAAFRSINHYKRLWFSNEATLARVSSPPFSDPWPSLLGRLPSLGLTLVLLISWIFLLDLAGLDVPPAPAPVARHGQAGPAPADPERQPAR